MAVYIIIISGNTISFAGKPKINAVSIIPSSPIIFPNGSRKSEIWVIIALSPTVILDNSQMISPAGAATVIALPNTNSVLSKRERVRILPNCGFL